MIVDMNLEVKVGTRNKAGGAGERYHLPPVDRLSGADQEARAVSVDG